VLVPVLRLVVLEDEGEHKVSSVQAPVNMEELVSGYCNPLVQTVERGGMIRWVAKKIHLGRLDSHSWLERRIRVLE
jgi:hypothetical protein